MRYGDWELPGIAVGHVLDVLAKLPENSVHTVCTSPPYWGLRNYKTAPLVWGGEPTCKHAWDDERRDTKRGGQGGPGSTLRGGNVRPDEPWNLGTQLDKVSQGKFCRKCTAWCGHLGNEPTPELYIDHLVTIFRAVRRVLREDGTLWLNLGDSYNSNMTGPNPGGIQGKQMQSNVGYDRAEIRYARGSGLGKVKSPTLKVKDLCGIPWRAAFALQADGWWLRSDIVWEKPNSMPESATDRPTHNHEFIFLLTKSAQYYFDMEAVREPCKSGPSDIKKMEEARPRIGGKHKVLVDPFSKASATTNIGRHSVGDPSGRNVRSVWTITTEPYHDAHFAAFPRELPRRCIAAGTSEHGCCPTCGAPWEREVERQVLRVTPRGTQPSSFRAHAKPPQQSGIHTTTATVGWRPTCDCPVQEPIPCTVLDIFAGSGTTLHVAEGLGRLWFGIDLSDEYSKLMKKRTAQRSVLGLAGRMALRKSRT